MEKQMNKRSRTRIALAILLVAMLALVAFFAAFWVTLLHLPQFPRRVPPPAGVVPGDFELFYTAYTVVSTLNIALLVILIAIYADIYRKTRSPFTIGLVIFGVVFLVKDLTASPLLIATLGYRAFGLGVFEFLPGLFEFVALSILLYLSIRY